MISPKIADALARKYQWKPVNGMASLAAPDPQVWPALAAFATAEANWTHSDEYDAEPPQFRWRQLYLDLDHRVALFVLTDH
jgi:hypothetical protein